MASSWEEAEFGNPFQDHPDRKGTVNALELVEAIATPQITLIIGSEQESLTMPEGILKQITYFKNCLRNQFEETNTRTFELPDEDTKTVKQLLAFLMQPIDNIWTVEPGQVALLADKWCSFDLRDSILKATWDHWYRLRTLENFQIAPRTRVVQRELRNFRTQTCKHHMRFFPIDFLANMATAGFQFPEELTSDTSFCHDFANWCWVRDVDSQRKQRFGDDSPPGGPEVFRRLMNGVLSVDWTPESDGTTEFANTYLAA